MWGTQELAIEWFGLKAGRAVGRLWNLLDQGQWPSSEDRCRRVSPQDRSHISHSAVSLVTMWKVRNDYSEAWRLPETSSVGLFR